VKPFAPKRINSEAALSERGVDPVRINSIKLRPSPTSLKIASDPGRGDLATSVPFHARTRVRQPVVNLGLRLRAGTVDFLKFQLPDRACGFEPSHRRRFIDRQKHVIPHQLSLKPTIESWHVASQRLAALNIIAQLVMAG
jgi:hypothetical protein